MLKGILENLECFFKPVEMEIRTAIGNAQCKSAMRANEKHTKKVLAQLAIERMQEAEE